MKKKKSLEERVDNWRNRAIRACKTFNENSQLPYFAICHYTPEADMKKLAKEDTEQYLHSFTVNRFINIIKQDELTNSRSLIKLRLYVGDVFTDILSSLYNNFELEDMTLLPVPPADMNMYRARWDVISTIISTYLPIQNGINLFAQPRIDDLPPTPPKHHEGGKMQDFSKLLKEEDIRGKVFILLDDILTTGHTIRSLKETIENMGGHVIMALEIAKTKKLEEFEQIASEGQITDGE